MHSEENTEIDSEDHGKSTLPGDGLDEMSKNLDYDWEYDPENARNWPNKKKWTATAIVNTLTSLS